MLSRILKTAILAGIIAVLACTSWLTFTFHHAPRMPVQKIHFEVREGQTVAQIAESLIHEKLLTSKWAFLLGYRLFTAPRSLKAGEYVFQAPLSPKEILNILVQGKIFLRLVTIPEGLTRFETAEHLESQDVTSKTDFLRVSADPKPIRDLDPEAADLEGYLFPETYYFPKGTPAAQIAAVMVGQFKSVFSESWKSRAAELKMSVRDVVILASLIEKETYRSDERSLVSAVFHNRLRLGMKLDCDPTIVYALKITGKYHGRLRTRDLKLDSPYNTYHHAGLPPGPIASPGRAALKAALYPADTDFLYFVSRNDGSHQFSRSFREHMNAVNKYQRRRR